jgi:hypothetical protein
MSTTRDAVEQTLALSIDHLPPNLRAHLHLVPHLGAVSLDDSGWRIYVPNRDPAGLPWELAPILAAARDLGCWWVTFDLGVDPVDDLDTYDTPDVEADRFEEQAMAEIDWLTSEAA